MGHITKVFSKLLPSHITFKLSLLVSLVVTFAFTSLEIYKFLDQKSQLTLQINTEQYAQAKFIAKDIQDKINKRSLFISGLADTISPKTMQSEALLLIKLKIALSLQIFFHKD
ncbi:hypothetical protein P20652_1173 [Pseudoalteromonas sp. BSi20652]|uniref:hypothetical protein n=1 Tax=Pseudoalteromonas sp. BSi20652 TaxID=388384 RepID=UPI000231808F|nr:hypothetical protein [Pseudoalteromonas sp. BSi20652]GAA59312.1 hypothetical protein P20652_1173 [Pseudoalteromonas sp. BSi20652]